MEGGSAREPGLGRRAPEPAKLDSSNPCSEPSRGGFENWQLPASDSQGSLLPLCPWLRERRKEISKVISRFPEQTEEPGIRGRGGPEGGGRRWLATASALLSEISGLPDAAGASGVPWPRGPVMWPGTETRTLRQAAWASKPPWQRASSTSHLAKEERQGDVVPGPPSCACAL